MKGKNILTTGDVARICNVCSRTVGKWFDRGLLGGYRLPLSKDRRIFSEDLIKFLEEHKMPYDKVVLEKYSKNQKVP